LCITSCINSAIFSNLSPPGFFDFVFGPEENKGGEFGVKASVLENSMLVTFEVFYYEFEDLQVDFFNSQQFAYVTEMQVAQRLMVESCRQGGQRPWKG
jgi:iron complex outermembrane receptor protein